MVHLYSPVRHCAAWVNLYLTPFVHASTGTIYSASDCGYNGVNFKHPVCILVCDSSEWNTCSAVFVENIPDTTPPQYTCERCRMFTYCTLRANTKSFSSIPFSSDSKFSHIVFSFFFRPSESCRETVNSLFLRYKIPTFCSYPLRTSLQFRKHIDHPWTSMVEPGFAVVCHRQNELNNSPYYSGRLNSHI